MIIKQYHIVSATTWNEIKFKEVKEWIDSLKEKIFVMIKTNDYITIIMTPDDSKEHQEIRDEFIKKIDRPYWRWIYASYGDEGNIIYNQNRYES